MKFKSVYISGFCEGTAFSELVFLDNEMAKNSYFTLFASGTSDSFLITLRTDKKLVIDVCVLEAEYTFTAQTAVLVNGYQSWSSSGEFLVNEKPEKLSPLFKNLVGGTGDYFFYKPYGSKNNLHSHWFTYFTEQGSKNTAKFWLGSANERNGYTQFEFDSEKQKVYIHKDRRGAISTGSIVLYDLRFGLKDDDAFLDTFFSTKNDLAPVSGWTSWYYHYTDISETVILDNLEAFKKEKIPPGIFQIDDGWQACTGDWLRVNEKFPRGLKPISDAIKAAGHKPGLWLAPLVAAETSDLYKTRKDLFLTYDGERPVRAGFNPMWGSLAKADYYALDIYKPQTIDYLEQVFKTVLNDWGFEMVKLDFLFGAGMLAIGEKSRAQVMYDAMKLLRRLCGNKLILGCGVPLSMASGLVDYCRIGADIGPSWETGYMKSIGLHERISTVNSLRNTISRRFLSRRSFNNDPDVFMLRKNKSNLKPAEKLTLFTLNLLFGDLVFTSDNIAEYDAQTMALYKSQYPFKKQEILSLSCEDDFYYIDFLTAYGRFLYVVNLSEKDRKIDLSAYPDAFVSPVPALVKKHEGQMIPILDKRFPVQILESSMHIFPGSEFDVIEPHREGAVMELNPQVLQKGIVVFTEQSGMAEFKVQDRNTRLMERYGVRIREINFAE